MSAVVKTHAPEFRPMLEDDLDEVMLIENAMYEFPWTRGIFVDCLQVGYCCWIMYDSVGRIDGYGVMAVAAGECHILNLCIRGERQGAGYGGILLDHLLHIAGRHKADVAFLEVRPSNAAARHLYEKAGFHEVGMRRNYYPARDGREDAIIMAKTILD